MKMKRKEEGRIDEILMVKMLLIQGWYGLSDYEADRQANDRISFRHFLAYPETIPDRSTLWRFQERLNNLGKVHRVWDELQRQLDEKGYRVKRGTIQVATFIITDPGHAPSDKSRGMRPRHVEVVMGGGAKKDPNHSTDIYSIR